MSDDSIPRRPPAHVRRQLRQEVNFGCAQCGVPIIQYHHIVPFADEQHHDPNRMIALCPNHHDHAGPDAEALTPDQLYRLKQNPHNTDEVEYAFLFESDLPQIMFAGNRFGLSEMDHMCILEVEGESLIEIWFENNMLEFGAKLFDSDHNLMAKIDRNEWVAYTDEVWDMKYRANMFKIWHEPRDIGLKVEYDSKTDKISLEGSLYYSGMHISADASGISTDGMLVKNSLFVDKDPCISLVERNGTLYVQTMA